MPQDQTSSGCAGPEQAALADARLPDGLVPGRSTPVFTLSTAPAALLKSHHTTVWAQLVVSHGAVSFFDDVSGWQATAIVGRPVTIVPDRKHHIEPGTDAEFHVQFYTKPTSDDSA